MIKTGIFGGSFNPIHNGHITLARYIREAAELDEVWLMVSPQNPLKQQAGLLADELRLRIALQAVEDEPHITVSDYEFHLPRPSYTWNTLQSLRRDFPDRQFVLMIGGDNWQHFSRWYHADDILRISSTDIRRRVRQGKSITGMVPDCIIQAVTTHYASIE